VRVGGCGGSGRPARAPRRFSPVLDLLGGKWQNFSPPLLLYLPKTWSKSFAPPV